jgi:hypothetical protein
MAGMSVIKRQEGMFVSFRYLHNQFNIIGISHGSIVPKIGYLVTPNTFKFQALMVLLTDAFLGGLFFADENLNISTACSLLIV